MKKLMLILAVTFISGCLTSCFPLFYGDDYYSHGRGYHNERYEGRRSHRHMRNSENYNRHDNGGQYNQRDGY